MNILLMDIGNTSIKIAMKEKNANSFTFIKSYKKLNLFYKFFYKIKEKYDIEKIFYASVRGEQTGKIIEKLNYIMQPKVKDFLIRIAYLPQAGFNFNYNPIKSYGDDRLALLYYISEKYPEKAVLAIDSGTAITIDTMYKSNYEGGFIFCGINLCLKSLYKRTKQLPLINIEDIKNIEKLSLGFSTKESILYGICNSFSGLIINAIDTFKEKLKNKYNISNPKLSIILTGGDAEIIYNLIKDRVEGNDILVDKNAVILGIYNYSKIFFGNL